MTVRSAHNYVVLISSEKLLRDARKKHNGIPLEKLQLPS
jgi:hypothetical protein